MSSILKALKKVEEEKAAQRNALPLASDVARNRRSRKSASFWKIPAALVVVAVTAILSTFAAMGGFTTAKTRPTTPPDVNGAVTPLGKGATPVAVQVQSVQFPSDGTNEPAVVQKQQSAPVPIPKQQVKKPAVKPAVPTSAKPPAFAPAVAVRRETGPFLRTTIGSISISENHSDFKVSGIGWQKESSSRLAVVNGVAVTQGATVDGAKVVEILPDRVRLSQGGSIFEILLGKINQYR